MKRSIIKRLLYDNLCSCEKIQMDEEYWKIYDVIKKVEDNLFGKIGGDGDLTDLIKRYTDALDELAVEESGEYFKYGVKIGVLLGMELCEEEMPVLRK